MTPFKKLEKGRGAPSNPSGRFERLAVEPDYSYLDDIGGVDEDERPLRTEFYKEHAKSILSFNASPDTPDVTMNPYRGCEHGCIYCFARPNHEYMGLSAGLDFESRIFVKHNAPELLRRDLSKPSWVPQSIMVSGATDCYQPVERKLELTRRCLAVLADFRNPANIVTKNHLVTRDIDILKEMAAMNTIRVMFSITTLDPELAKRMEPRTSRPAARLKAVETLAKAGIPVCVMVAPVIPGLTDHEIPDILRSVADAGAQGAGYSIVRLSHGLKDLFQEWLEVNYPMKKSRVLMLLRDIRGGQLNDTRFGTRKRGEGAYAEQIGMAFALQKKKHGLDKGMTALSTASFRRRGDAGQMELF